MTASLAAVVRDELLRPLPDPIAFVATGLGSDEAVRSVLFYGSNLRTGSLDGVLDFYVLTDGPVQHGIWPTVSYREVAWQGRTLRAKVATMTHRTFVRAARGGGLDATIWARFAQPAAIAFLRGSPDPTVDAVASAVRSAARVAALVGPRSAPPLDYWRALFGQTYRAEMRFEGPDRASAIVRADPDRYACLLPLAWEADGIAFSRRDGSLAPRTATPHLRRAAARWRIQRLAGRPLNVARLVRAVFTFDGAARYAAWKIERHTGVPIVLTPWRERHPILAAPGVAWRIWRQRA